MKEYMVGIFLISLLLGLFELLLYKQKGGIGERGAFAVLLLFSVVGSLPGLAVSFNTEFPSFEFDGGESGEYYDVAKEAFEEGIKKEISREFSVNEEYISVYAENFSFEKMTAEKIKVILSARAVGIDPKTVEEHINSLKLGGCEVDFEIG